jgi:hypothetical protein
MHTMELAHAPILPAKIAAVHVRHQRFDEDFKVAFTVMADGSLECNKATCTAASSALASKV